MAYYGLGRVAHLLADMSVPAHVHLDSHAGFEDGDDSYEEFTAEDEHYKLVTAEDARNLSVNLSKPSYSAPTGDDPWLLYLFYGLAETADDYDSDDVNGEVAQGAYNQWDRDIHPVALAEIYQPELQGAAIRYTAGLFKRFWDDTHATVSVQASGRGSVDPEGSVSVRLGANATFTATPETGHEVDSWVAYYHESGHTSTLQTGGTTCTIPSVTEDMTITVYFKEEGGEEPIGDLVIIQPAASPYETGNTSVTFEFRVPDGTNRIYWSNSNTGGSGDFGLSASHTWKAGIPVEIGTNSLTFTARDASNNVLASTSFTVIRAENTRSITVTSDSCDWAYYSEGSPSLRFPDKEIVIGKSQGDWTEAVIRFELPSLPGRDPATNIGAQLNTTALVLLKKTTELSR